MSRKHPNAAELKQRQENARKEVERRSKPWQPYRGGEKLGTPVVYPSLASRISLATIENRKPCPCENKDCTAKLEES